MLGIKYEVAVQTDLVRDNSGKFKNKDDALSGKEVFRGVVDAAVLGEFFVHRQDWSCAELLYRLGDSDDDVCSVAASCLLPFTDHFVEDLPEEPPRVLAILWTCLGDMKDDLSSSVGAVMDLLGRLVPHDRVIETLADSSKS